MFRNGVSWAGLAAGPGAWAIATQATYFLVPWVCAHGWPLLVPAIDFVLALLAATGGVISFRAGQPHANPSSERESRFLADMGALVGLLFARRSSCRGAAGSFLTGASDEIVDRARSDADRRRGVGARDRRARG